MPNRSANTSESQEEGGRTVSVVHHARRDDHNNGLTLRPESSRSPRGGAVIALKHERAGRGFLLLPVAPVGVSLHVVVNNSPLSGTSARGRSFRLVVNRGVSEASRVCHSQARLERHLRRDTLVRDIRFTVSIAGRSAVVVPVSFLLPYGIEALDFVHLVELTPALETFAMR